MSRIRASSGGGSGGGPSTSANSISNIFVAGQNFAANTSYVVRWGKEALGENPTEVYAADYDASSQDNFWAFGIALSPTAVLAGGNIDVYSFGTYTLGSSDTPFSVANTGDPVWLTSAGAFSIIAPSGDTEADDKIGIVMSPTQIWINDQVMGVGGSGGGGGGGGGVDSLNGLTGAVTIAGVGDVLITEVGNTIEVAFTGSGSGNVTGVPPTGIRDIAIWANTIGTLIEDSGAQVQVGGAVQAQAFVGDRQILNNVDVPDHYLMISSDVEMISGDIILGVGSQLILL